MLRKLLCVVVGVVLGMMATKAVHSFSTRIHPAPSSSDLLSEESFRAYMEGLPVEVYYLIIISHVLGACIAAFATSRLNKSNSFYLGLISVFVMIVFAIITFLQIPFPPILILADILSMLVLGLLAARMGS